MSETIAPPARFRRCDFSVPELMETLYGDLRTQGFDLACRTMVPDEWLHPDGRYVRIAHVAGITEVWIHPNGKDQPYSSHGWRGWDIGRTAFLSWLVGVGREIEGTRAGT